jgi:hypothetical protein
MATSFLARLFKPRCVRLAHALVHSKKHDDRKGALTLFERAEDREKAIPFLMEAFRENRDEHAYWVSLALATIPTKATLEPLLEVFRTVRPTILSSDRMHANNPDSPGFERSGEDGTAAAALLNIPDSLVDLRKNCSSEEYERLVILGNRYRSGPRYAVDNNTLLGQLATPKAIGEMLWNLFQEATMVADGILPSVRPGPKEGLRMAGAKANSILLEELQKPTWCAAFQREIRSVLTTQGGDEPTKAEGPIQWYNRGVGQYQKGQFKAAIDTFPVAGGGVRQTGASAEPDPRPESNTVGVLFSISALGGVLYGKKCQEEFFSIVDARRIAGSEICVGDVFPEAEFFCVKVKTATPGISQYIREVFGQHCQAAGLAPVSQRFMSDGPLNEQPLISKGTITSDGEYCGEPWY